MPADQHKKGLQAADTTVIMSAHMTAPAWMMHAFLNSEVLS